MAGAGKHPSDMDVTGCTDGDTPLIPPEPRKFSGQRTGGHAPGGGPETSDGEYQSAGIGEYMLMGIGNSHDFAGGCYGVAAGFAQNRLFLAAMQVKAGGFLVHDGIVRRIAREFFRGSAGGLPESSS